MDASGGAPPSRLVGPPATEIAAKVRSGEWSAIDVVRAHLAHIDAVDARIGAFRVVRREAALAEAATVDAAAGRAALPLAGVPVAVKDNVAVAGEVATDGSLAGSPRPAAADHPVVARLRAAGAVVVGITRVPELCLYAATDAPGAVTRNPWDTALSPGGSSGGSAAAVAAGCVPIAHGNDGMGSLRLPAAACGLVTLKPGRGVLPGGIGADDWSGMAVNGALATTVADLALATAVLAGEEPGALPEPGRPLRIAVSGRSPVPGVRADGPTRAALEATAALLREAGHEVVRRTPAVPPGAAAGALARWMAGAHDDAEHLGLDRAGLQPRSRTHARIGAAVRRAGLGPPAAAAPPGWARGPAGGAWSGGPPPSGSGSARRGSSTTSTCCSRRSRAGRRCPPGRGTSGPSWPTSPPTPGGHRGPPRGTWPASRRWSGRRRAGRRAPRSRSSWSAPREPKGDYSGLPRSWDVGSRGPAARRSSTPPRHRSRHPSEQHVRRRTAGCPRAGSPAAPRLPTAPDRQGSHGPSRRPRRPRAQPQGRPPRPAPRGPDRVHGSVRIRQVQPRLRHDLRRGPAPVRRIAVGLRPPVPRPDGQARRRLHRGPVARGVDRPEVDQPQPTVDRRHHHRGLRLPAAALRPRRSAALPQLRQADLPADPAADRRPGAGHGGGHPLPGARAGRPRPQGRVRRPVQLAADPGLLPRPG